MAPGMQKQTFWKFSNAFLVFAQFVENIETNCSVCIEANPSGSCGWKLFFDQIWASNKLPSAINTKEQKVKGTHMFRRGHRMLQGVEPGPKSRASKYNGFRLHMEVPLQ